MRLFSMSKEKRQRELDIYFEQKRKAKQRDRELGAKRSKKYRENMLQEDAEGFRTKHRQQQRESYQRKKQQK